MHIDATIICERDSHKGIIIGKKGSMLKKIGSTARYEIEKMLDQQVNLKLWVKVKKDWRDSEFLMKNFGYRDELAPSTSAASNSEVSMPIIPAMRIIVVFPNHMRKFIKPTRPLVAHTLEKNLTGFS